MKLGRNLQNRFFISYSLVLLLIAVCVSVPMYLYLHRNIERNLIIAINETVTTTAERLENSRIQFENISNQLYLDKDADGKTVLQYLRQMSENPYSFEFYQSRRAVEGFLFLTSTIYSDIDRISLYTDNGSALSNRFDVDEPSLAAVGRARFHETASSEGELMIRFAASDPVLAQQSAPVFSFVRLLAPFENRFAVLEAQYKVDEMMPADKLAHIQGAVLHVLGRDRQILYSSGNSTLTPDAANYQYEQKLSKSGLTIQIIAPKQEAFRPLNVFRDVTILSVAALIAFSMLVFYLLSRVLTLPLKKLKKAIDSIDLHDGQPDIDNLFHMDEIESINRSFRRMTDRLHHSLEETIRFRTQQLQSHFDALQSQINPHFLFNMLGVIQASAENGHNARVVHLSSNLASFLSYSIATASPVTTLDKELAFTAKYLELMQSRYLHRLQYRIETDESMEGIVVPKLILQPLVENCIQHGFKESGENLEIAITSTMTEELWTLVVRDNGCGFPQAELERIRTRIGDYLQSLDDGVPGEKLTLGGMGVVSTFARLRFLFREQIHFSVMNGEDGGAVIQIQGALKRGGTADENYRS